MIEAILGLLKIIPDIWKKISELLDEKKRAEKKERDNKIDKLKEETKSADTDEKRKDLSKKWSDLITDITKR